MTFVSRPADRGSMTPTAWKNLAGEGFHSFNPALISDGKEGFIMAYRFVANSDLIRRIAICRLDSDLNVVKGSAVNLSDLIKFVDPLTDGRSREWFADPRLFTLQGKTWMVWNDGYRSEGNHQFMVELEIEGELRPSGPAREITINDARRKNEKNWAFFEVDGKVWVVYSITPHKILSVDMSSELQVICQTEVSVEWNARYSWNFGALRGGAQPVRVGEKFVNLVHSSFNMPEGREYVAAAYEYSATFPFAPIRELPVPINLRTPRAIENAAELENRLNSKTSHVVYPTGLVISDDKVFVSAGVNDTDLALISGTLPDLTAGMVSIRSGHVTHLDRSAGISVRPKPVDLITPKIPVFWWNAKGNLMNSIISQAVFKRGNFGDDASPLLVSKLSGIESRRVTPGERKLLAIGSILHRATDGDIVWGSGLKSDEALDAHPGGNIMVTAVRGPRTLKVLKRAGWDTSNIKAMFDPGVLLRHVYSDRLARYNVDKNNRMGKIRIIPHFKDDLVFKRQRPDLLKHFISADGDPIKILEGMLGAELVISSSLHGIIFAESLGIPAIWIDSPGGEAQFKYLDYYEGTGRFGVQVVPSITEALNAQAPNVPEFDFEKLLETFPHKEIAELADKRLPMATKEMIGAKARTSYRDDFEHSTSKSVVLRNGILWVAGKKGTISLAPLDIMGTYSAVTVTVRPATVLKTKRGFTLKVSVDGGATITVTWASGSLGAKIIQIPVSKEIWNRGLTLSFYASSVGMGVGRMALESVGMSLSITSIGAALPE